MPARPCRTDSFYVSIDLDTGQYLLIEVTAAPTRGKFSVADGSTEEIILDEKGKGSAEWPRKNQKVNLGTAPMAVGAIFLPASRYTFKVSLCAENGLPIEEVKDCTFES